MELSTETGEKWSWESSKTGPCSACPVVQQPLGGHSRWIFFSLIPLYKRNKNDVSLLLVVEKPSLSGITTKGFSSAEMLCRVWQDSAV